MIRSDNAYSRLVTWLKITLPVIALAILSTLFLVARAIDPDRAIPYADVDVDEMMRESRLGEPRYATVTPDGTAITLGASVARPVPGAADRIEAERLSARIELPGGTTLDISAPSGEIDGTAAQAVLAGGIRVASSDGTTLTGDSLTTALGETRIDIAGPVEADMPAGHLTAGSARITAQDAASHLMVFKDGVRLVYEPGQSGVKE